MIKTNNQPHKFTHQDNVRKNAILDNHQLVLNLCQHLPQRDKLLIEQIIKHGCSIRDAAAIFKEHETTLHRRFNMLLKRLQSSEFLMLTEMPERVPFQLKASCTLVIVKGKSLRHTANALNISLHKVRSHVAELRALVKGVGVGAYLSPENPSSPISTHTPHASHHAKPPESPSPGSPGSPESPGSRQPPESTMQPLKHTPLPNTHALPVA